MECWSLNNIHTHWSRAACASAGRYCDGKGNQRYVWSVFAHLPCVHHSVAYVGHTFDGFHVPRRCKKIACPYADAVLDGYPCFVNIKLQYWLQRSSSKYIKLCLWFNTYNVIAEVPAECSGQIAGALFSNRGFEGAESVATKPIPFSEPPAAFDFCNKEVTAPFKIYDNGGWLTCATAPYVKALFSMMWLFLNILTHACLYICALVGATHVCGFIPATSTWRFASSTVRQQCRPT